MPHLIGFIRSETGGMTPTITLFCINCALQICTFMTKKEFFAFFYAKPLDEACRIEYNIDSDILCEKLGVMKTDDLVFVIFFMMNLSLVLLSPFFCSTIFYYFFAGAFAPALFLSFFEKWCWIGG